MSDSDHLRLGDWRTIDITTNRPNSTPSKPSVSKKCHLFSTEDAQSSNEANSGHLLWTTSVVVTCANCKPNRQTTPSQQILGCHCISLYHINDSLIENKHICSDENILWQETKNIANHRRQCEGKQLNQINLWTFRCPEDRERTHKGAR